MSSTPTPKRSNSVSDTVDLACYERVESPVQAPPITTIPTFPELPSYEEIEAQIRQGLMGATPQQLAARIKEAEDSAYAMGMQESIEIQRAIQLNILHFAPLQAQSVVKQDQQKQLAMAPPPPPPQTATTTTTTTTTPRSAVRVTQETQTPLLPQFQSTMMQMQQQHALQQAQLQQQQQQQLQQMQSQQQTTTSAPRTPSHIQPSPSHQTHIQQHVQPPQLLPMQTTTTTTTTGSQQQQSQGAEEGPTPMEVTSTILDSNVPL